MANAGLMTIENACVSLPELSATRTVNEYVPAVAGVPEIVPEPALIESPGGGVPVRDQERGPCPPVNAMGAL